MREINTYKLILFVEICILTSCNNMDSTDFIIAEIEEEININEKELKLPNHKSVKILRNVMLVIKQLVAMLGFYVFTFCIANNTSIIAEESRFETW